MTGRDRDVEEDVRVVVPEEAPVLTSGAARVLLRIVRDAQVRTESTDEVGREAA